MKLRLRSIKKLNLRTRALDKRIDKVGMLLIVAALLFIILNIFSYQYIYRADLTSNKTFSLSDATKNVIKNLENDVTIDLYYSNNVPTDFLAVRRDILDLMEEYETNSDGNVSVNIINPDSEDFRANATAAGIREVSYSEFAGDSLEIATSFLGAVVRDESDTKLLEFLPRISDLEYQVSSAIIDLSSIDEDKRTIGFLIGHKENNLFVDYSQLNEELSGIYNFEEVSLSEGRPIDPEEVATLVIAAPKDEFAERDFFEIEQYMLKGGNLIVLADHYALDRQDPTLNINETNFYEFLSEFGVNVQEDILLDESFSPIPAGFGGITYPYWVLVQPTNINTDIPAFSTLESLNVFWANALEVDEIDGFDYQTLFTTTERAWAQPGGESLLDVDVQQNFNPVDQRTFELATKVSAQEVISLYEGKSPPPLADEDTKSLRKKDDIILESGSLSMYVIGDADFLTTEFNQLNPNNITFFVNLLGLITDENDLGQIRSKISEARPLVETSQQERNLYKAINIAGMPIIVSAIGVGINSYNKRRGSKI